LVTFFGALATLLLLRALERPRWQRWVLYGLAIAATGACNLEALCLLAGHLICVVIHCCRPPKGSAGRRWGVVPGFCLAALAGVALDTPIIIEGHRQAAEQLGGHSRPALSQLTGLTGSLGMWPQLFSSTAVAAIVIMLAVASLGGPRRRASVYSLTAALVPVVILWCASQGPVSYWYIRYLLFTVPAWAVAAGLGIAGVAAGATALCSRSLRWAGQRRAALGSAGPGPAGPRWATLRSAGLWRVAAVAVMLALVAAAGGPAQGEIRQAEAHNWWSYPDPSGAIPADYQGAANVIAEHEKPGDGIVFKRDDRWMVDTGVYYYLRGRAKPTDVFLVKTPVQAAGLEAVECAHPALCLHGDPRLWVVYQGVTVGPYAAIEPAKAAALHAAGYATQHIYEEDGITVALMIRA
jgi:mannosyltransferase